MQVSSTNYNPLGKIGPHYERPEYRPPENSADQSDQSSPSLGRSRGDRSTLSVKNTDVPVKKALSLSTGKTSLGQARDLVSAVAAQILELPPLSTDLEPHRQLPSSLMTPVYA